MALTLPISTKDGKLQSLFNTLERMNNQQLPFASSRDTSTASDTFQSGSDVIPSWESCVATKMDNSYSSRGSDATSNRLTMAGTPPSDCTCTNSSEAAMFRSSRRDVLLPLKMSSRDRLNALRLNDLLCDVTVLCHHHVFPAHQAVLVSASKLCASLIDAARKQYQLKMKRVERQRACDGVERCSSWDNETDSDCTTSPNLGCTGDFEIEPRLQSQADLSLLRNGESRVSPLPLSRIRGGGEEITEQLALQDRISSGSAKSWSTPACDDPGTSEGGFIVSSNDQDSAGGSNDYVVMCKKELEVIMESKRIRVKTVTSRVTLTPKTKRSSVNRRQLKRTGDCTSGSLADWSTWRNQPTGNNNADLKVSPSRTIDSGVCLQEHSTSNPNSTRLTTALATNASTNRSCKVNETNSDPISADGTLNTEDYFSESTNGEMAIPLHETNSGMSLCRPSSWKQTKDFDKFAEPASRHNKLLLPRKDLDEMSVKFSSIPCANDNYASGTNTTRSLSPVTPNDLTIKIDSVDPDIFDVLLDLAYTGSFTKLSSFAVERFMEVNAAARSLQMNGVNVLSVKAFKEALTHRNFVELWNLAERTQNKLLADAVVVYLVQHLESVWMSPLLLQLPYERMMRVFSACENAALKLKPDLMLRTYMAWIKMEPTSRCHTVKAMWPTVCRSAMTIKYVQQLLAHDKIVKSSEELRQELEKLCSKSLVASPTSTCSQPSLKDCTNLIPTPKLNSPSAGNFSSRATSRVRSDNELYISHRLGVSPYVAKLRKDTVNAPKKIRSTKYPSPRSTQLSLRLTPEKEKVGTPQALKMMAGTDLRSASKSPKPSLASSVSVVSEEIETLSDCLVETQPKFQRPLIVVGKSEPLGEVLVVKLEVRDGNWFEEIIELNILMEDKQSVHFHDFYVILVGGEKDSSRKKLHTACLCDLRTNWIIQLPDTHLGRSNAAVFMMESTLYVAGGKGRYGEDISEVEALDESGVKKELRWKVVASMKVKRSSHAIVTSDAGIAYAVGGGTSRCERFHPKLKKWTDLPTLPDDFSKFTSVEVVVKNNVVAMLQQRPAQIYVLKENRSEWVQYHVTGRGPSTVVSATSSDSSIVVVDDMKMVYTFVLGENKWKAVTKITCLHFKPVLIVSLKDSPPRKIKWFPLPLE